MSFQISFDRLDQFLRGFENTPSKLVFRDIAGGRQMTSGLDSVQDKILFIIPEGKVISQIEFPISNGDFVSIAFS